MKQLEFDEALMNAFLHKHDCSSTLQYSKLLNMTNYSCHFPFLNPLLYCISVSSALMLTSQTAIVIMLGLVFITLTR